MRQLLLLALLSLTFIRAWCDSNPRVIKQSSSVTQTSIIVTPSISLPSVNTATVGATLPAGLLFEASGATSPYTFIVSALPPGMSITDAPSTQRTISGIPTQTGTFPISVTVTDANGVSAVSAPYALTVVCPNILIAAPTVSTAIVGASLPTGIQFIASNGYSPYTFTIGSLPPGLSVTDNASPQTTISGIPTQTGTFPISVTATDSYGCSAVNTPYMLTVGCPTIVIATPSVSTAIVGQSLPTGIQFIASNGYSPYTFTVGSLPPGLSVTDNVSPQTTISGIPTQIGVFPISVTATDAYGCWAVSAPYALTVRCASITINLPTTTTALAGVSIAGGLPFTASGGDTPFSFVFSSLPNGLSIVGSSSIDRVLGGAVTQIGTYPISATATDANGCTVVSPAYFLSVLCPTTAPITLTPSSATLTCSAGSVTLTTNGTGTYLWSDGSTSSSLVVSEAGSYSVLVTPTTGCTAAATSTINSNTTAPTVGLLVSSSISCANPSVTLTASGGDTYAFDGPSVVWVSINTAVVSTSGVYSVTATLANTGCFSITTITVTGSVIGVTPMAIIQASSSAVCPGSSVTIVATVSGTATYGWFNNGQLVSTMTPPLVLNNVQAAQAGSYVLVVTGGCGSNTTTAFSLTVNPPPVVTLSLLNSGAVLQSTGGVFYERMIVIDKVGGYEIRQVDSSSTGFFDITRVGPYRLTVTGANGCQTAVESTIAALPR